MHECLDDPELFVNELQMMYGDNDRRLNSTTRAMQEYQQLPNAAVRVNANRLRANWRTAGWNLITHKGVLYDMPWAGLRHTLTTKVRPPISSGKDRFDRPDHLFDCTAASAFQPDDKKPGRQQQQWQTGESQKDGEKKRNFRPSTLELVENTSGTLNPSSNSNNSGAGNSQSGKSNKSSGGSCANLSLARCFSKEIYKSQKAHRQSTLCGSGDHKTYLCTKSGKSSPPD
jgi:hypothetical protein